MHKSLRCTDCGISWPRTNEYKDCPKCKRATWASWFYMPLDIPVACSLKSHFDFERYYKRREEARARKSLGVLEQIPNGPQLEV